VPGSPLSLTCEAEGEAGRGFGEGFMKDAGRWAIDAGCWTLDA